jgi:hypothetical protein
MWIFASNAIVACGYLLCSGGNSLLSQQVFLLVVIVYAPSKDSVAVYAYVGTKR